MVMALKGVPCSDDVREKARALCSAGANAREVATELGVTAKTVYRWCEDIIRARKDRRHEQYRMAVRLRAEGASRKEIAEATGLTISQVEYATHSVFRGRHVIPDGAGLGRSVLSEVEGWDTRAAQNLIMARWP